MRCPLCRENQSVFFTQDKKRSYWQCPLCYLIFVPSEYHLSHTDEKNIYDLHENDINDEKYRKFLSQLSEPLFARLKQPAQGLDFGCGPGPALAQIFKEKGFDMEVYDPFYCNHSHLLSRKYDFITATEVVEHVSDLYKILNKLWSMLKAEGFLGLMTQTYDNATDFKNWYYKNDPTHIAFFSKNTWLWWAHQQSCKVEIINDRTIILIRKPIPIID